MKAFMTMLMDGVMPNLKAALAAVVRGAMAVGLVE